MSDDDSAGFAPPPFQPAAAVAALKRDLRALGLTERAGCFERRGLAIARVVQSSAALDGATLTAARVRRPSRNSPEWLPKVLRSSADVRDFVADLKRQLALWSDRDD